MSLQYHTVNVHGPKEPHVICIDDWSQTSTRDGHVPGAWDCPCGPWVRTDISDDDSRPDTRSVRHVEFGDRG